MSPMAEVPHDPSIVIASQIVRDVKVGGGKYRKELSRDTARLRAGLLAKNYIPGDKVNCEFEPLRMNADGTLTVEVFGGMLHGSDADTSLDPHFHHPFHLDIKSPLTLAQIHGMKLEDLLVNHCNDVVVDDGGNAQNMAINICLAGISALRQEVHLLIFTSSDPLKRLPNRIRDQVQHLVHFELLPDIQDRIAIHLPWEHETGKKGTFGLTTEPADISDAVRSLLSHRSDLRKLLASADCFVSSDLSYQVLRDHGDPGRYCTVVNAATKWRSTIAARSYGTDMVLPMNHKEAADVVHVIKHVGAEEELHKVKRVSLPPPLKTNGNEIDLDSLRKLDELLSQFTRYNHQHHRPNGCVAFNCPITFEEQGGLIVGTRNRHSIVAFTSTPDGDTEKRLLEQFGDHSEMNGDEIETMGAGDAAASMVAIFNTIDPQEFIAPFLEGRESTNTLLHQYAQSVFLSAMSRIVGSFLIHTQRTHLANVKLETFKQLFSDVALASLKIAQVLVHAPNNYALNDLEGFGMKVVTWQLGSVETDQQSM